MHGDKPQSERSRILECFLGGECPVVICTSLMGRGMDLPNVSQVRIQELVFKVCFIINMFCNKFEKKNVLFRL